MKSSFDLAMERLGKPIKELSSKQKAAMTEIENKYKAKTAEAELARDERKLKANGDFQQLEQIREDYAVEMASINSRRERDKEKIRGQ
jgi:hypothetical protein